MPPTFFGFGQEQDKEKATRTGFDAHLTKPADERALARIFIYPASSGMTRAREREKA